MMQGALEDISKSVGNTPIVRLSRVTGAIPVEIYVKCEFLNPGGSHKDRLAANMLRRAEAAGLKPGGTIVEATSGNTGASLALLAALRGYRCVFVMPDKMSQEKISHLRAFGARVVVCPTAVEPEDPRSYYQVAQRIARETPNCFYADQYHNPANPEAHYLSSGPEIWSQTGGDFEVFCAGMGTGGTLSGVGRFLRERKPEIKIVGVDPVGSLYYDFVKQGRITKPFAYKVEGIGEDFFPTTMNLKVLDDVVRVDDKECFLMTRDLTRCEGLFVGGSGGAAVAGAIKYAHTMVEQGLATVDAAAGGGRRPARILVFLADAGHKYLSKIFNDDWMRENGFLDDAPGLGTVRDILRDKRPPVTAHPSARLREVVDQMKRLSISQLPVVDQGRMCGIVAEVDLLRALVSADHESEPKTLDSPIAEVVEDDYATVTPNTKIELLQGVLADAKVAIVEDEGQLVGIVTKIDLIDYLARRTSAASAAPPPLAPAERGVPAASPTGKG
jgi:cystathionine beta-synthase